MQSRRERNDRPQVANNRIKLKDDSPNKREKPVVSSQLDFQVGKYRRFFPNKKTHRVEHGEQKYR